MLEIGVNTCGLAFDGEVSCTQRRQDGMGRYRNIGSHAARLDPERIIGTIFPYSPFLLGHFNLLIEVVDDFLPILPATEESQIMSFKNISAYRELYNYTWVQTGAPVPVSSFQSKSNCLSFPFTNQKRPRYILNELRTCDVLLSQGPLFLPLSDFLNVFSSLWMQCS